MTLAALGISVTSNGVNESTRGLDGLAASADKAEKATDRLAPASKKTDTSFQGLNKTTRTVDGSLERLAGRANGVEGALSRLATRAAVALGAALSIRGLQQYADAWSDMQSRVGSSIKSMEAAPAMMQRITDIANASYSPLQQTTEIFGRNVTTLNALGRSATDAADFTEALNHSLITTATKGQDADVVLNALSRAISNGKLRAMEFEVIMSRSPRVLEAIAESMGTNIIGLRALAEQGKVTGAVIVDALIDSLEKLRDEAGRMPATLADAGMIWTNVLTEWVGRIDQAWGATGELASKAIELAVAFRGTADAVIRIGNIIGTVVGPAFDALASNIELVGQVGTVAGAALLGFFAGPMLITGIGAATTALVTGLIPALGAVATAIKGITLAMLANPLGLLIGGLAAAVTAAFMFRDQIKQSVGIDTVQVMRDAANKTIGFFVGAYEYIKEVWANFPVYMSAIGKIAWNNLVAEFEKEALTINGITVIPGLNLSALKSPLTEREVSSFADPLKKFDNAQVDYIKELEGALAGVWENADGAGDAIAGLAGEIGGGGGSGGLTGAAGKANEALNKLIATADQLAEKMFPGEYARREAEALAAALDRYGHALDEFQRRAVEAEITDLFKAAELGVRRLEDQTKQSARNMGEELKNTLGSILGDLFSKPIEDADDFFDRIFSGLAQLGQANFSASMDMMFGNGDGLSKAVERGAKAGTEAGASTGWLDGIANLFGGAGGANGNPLMGALGAGAGGLGIGYQTQDPMMGALGGALSGIAGGPLGIAAGAIGGFLGGLFGMNKALQEAQEKLAKVRGEIDSFIDVGEGRGVGQMTQAFRDYWDKSHEYQELAMKAGDGALQKRLQDAVNTFFLQLDKDFRLGFEGTLAALSSGQGLNGAFVSAQQQIVGLREELKAFIADTEYMGTKLGELAGIDNAAEVAENLARARRAAQDHALSVLAGAEALTDMEKAALEAEGKASALQVTLEQLGMSAEDAASAITGALGMAMAKLRDEYARDINASINDLSGFGFLNEIVEAQAKYQERLRDASALGLDGASAMQELGLSLTGIARAAGLTQSQIDMLAQTFPAMAGMVEALVDNDVARRLADAQAALRAAYEAQRREIEQTISRLERFGQSVRKFRDEMRLSDSSPLGQRDQAEEALRQFRETAALAAAGDVEAQNRLTSVSQAALDEARAYYASSAKFSEIWTEIDRTLADIEDKTGRQLSDAQKQLNALDQQISGLIKIDNSVLSVADAIANLAAAQAASDAALAAQLAQLGAANSNSVSEVYKSVLGRDADAGGLAYWNNQMNQGKSLGQVTDQISNSREAQVQRLYQSILGRAADASGLQYWVGSNKAISQIEEELRYMKSMGSYATGGFTGYGGVTEPAGIVHRGEYVFDAAATSRIGLQNLEAMRVGRVGNDNGDVVAGLLAVRAELAAVKAELGRQTGVIALDGQETRKTIDRGNDAAEELSSNIKRVVAA